MEFDLCFLHVSLAPIAIKYVDIIGVSHSERYSNIDTVISNMIENVIGMHSHLSEIST